MLLPDLSSVQSGLENSEFCKVIRWFVCNKWPITNVYKDEKRSSLEQGNKTMKDNHYLKPAWTHNGSIKTDLPLTVIGKKKRKLIEAFDAGQLFCVGKVYIRTNNGAVRIR